MMKKMLFFALFLLILGTANLSAQVRIGGNGVPNTAAVLDLNATDVVNNGNLGLALPRVSLDTTNTKLNGATPVNGMVVYNTNTSMKGGQGAGVYVWVSNKWSQLVPSVPVTSITLNKSNLNLPVGYNWTPTVTYAPANATNQTVTWSSSNPSIATVNSSGVITGVAVGTAVITAKANDGGNASRTVNVNVWQYSTLDASMGGLTYRAVAIPNLGLWLVQPSRAGVPDTTAGGFNFYSVASAPSACINPWRFAGADTARALAQFLLDAPPNFAFYFEPWRYVYSGTFDQRLHTAAGTVSELAAGWSIEGVEMLRVNRRYLDGLWGTGTARGTFGVPVVCVRD